MPKQKKVQKSGAWSIPVSLLFIIFLAVSVFFNKLPIQIFGIYCIASLITFIFYAIDKSSAQSDSWRTPEQTLHVLALVGGWPGALIAQQKLRHKSSKKEFRIVFLATVLINCAVLFWMLSPQGSEKLFLFFNSF